jgi:hypothetical protein
MVILTPINLMKTKALFRNIDYDMNGSGAFSTFFVNIVVPTGGVGNVTMDGTPVTGFQTLTSNSAYSWKQLSVTSGSHYLDAPGGFNAFTYGLGLYNAYAYHLGYDYNTIPVGLNEHGHNINTTVFPNPFSESTTIQLDYPGVLASALLEIFSVNGKLVKQQMFSGNTIAVERTNITSGFYHFTVTVAGKKIANGKLAVD